MPAMTAEPALSPLVAAEYCDADASEITAYVRVAKGTKILDLCKHHVDAPGKFAPLMADQNGKAVLHWRGSRRQTPGPPHDARLRRLDRRRREFLDMTITAAAGSGPRPAAAGGGRYGRGLGTAGGHDAGKTSRAYREHRPYLVDLAFRMLGDRGAAEDVVQDAFARLMRADLGEIKDERGWLIVVTSRLCLDQIKSARSRRERAHDSSQIEFVMTTQSALADPADRVAFDDSVRLALLVVLQRLSPAERVVFVLHDIFRMPFDAVAETVGRTVLACRQLATRARQKITADQGGARFDVASAEHRLVTEKFIAACANGDLHGLLEVLAPDAWGDVDR